MAKPNISVARLSKALDQVRLVGTRLVANGFTLQTWVTPQDDQTLQLRDSYIILLNTVSENLDLKKEDSLRTRYPELFQVARGLHGQCCLLDHKYEVANVDVPINWKDVWETVNDRLPNKLAPLLERAIADESK